MQVIINTHFIIPRAPKCYQNDTTALLCQSSLLTWRLKAGRFHSLSTLFKIMLMK